MALFPGAQAFSNGDTILEQHRKSNIPLTPGMWTSARALTPMTVDQQHDGLSTPRG
jgi:hypothetical protein